MGFRDKASENATQPVACFALTTSEPKKPAGGFGPDVDHGTKRTIMLSGLEPPLKDLGGYLAGGGGGGG